MGCRPAGWLHGLALAALVATRAPEASARPRVFFVTGGGKSEPGSLGARSALDHAARAAGLAPVETVELAPALAPRAHAQLEEGTRALAELRFDDAVRALSAGIAELALTGGASLDAAQMDDLFLLRGVAELKLDEARRAAAWDDFVRAALLAPERILDAGRFAPAVVATWTRAVAEAQRRPRGVLVVRAGPGARVSIDGRPFVSAPAVVPGASYGQHYARVEEVGRAPWATVAVLAAPTLEIEVPPRASWSLDDGSAAERARRAGVDFALVAAPEAGSGAGPLLKLALIRASDGARQDEALVPVDPSGEAVDKAVARLVNESAPPPRLPRLSGAAERPRRWPYYAAGAAVLAAIAVTAAIVVSSGSAGSGFTAGLSPGQLGK